jgi:hypothetical protein
LDTALAGVTTYTLTQPGYVLGASIQFLEPPQCFWELVVQQITGGVLNDRIDALSLPYGPQHMYAVPTTIAPSHQFGPGSTLGVVFGVSTGGDCGGGLGYNWAGPASVIVDVVVGYGNIGG